MPKNREILEFSLFKNCANLSSITIDSDKLNYQSTNGILYTKLISVIEKAITLIEYPMNTGSRTYKITEEDTTEIARNVFYNH